MTNIGNTLDAAQPIYEGLLDEAARVVQSLDNRTLVAVKPLRSPPRVLTGVTECLMPYPDLAYTRQKDSPKGEYYRRGR